MGYELDLCNSCLHYRVCFMRMETIALATRVRDAVFRGYGLPGQEELWTCNLKGCPFYLKGTDDDGETL
jgi:hypothetical protein